MNKIFRVAVCQLKTIANKQKNIESAKKMIEKACKNDANICILPEMWNTPFVHEYFIKFAEEPYGETYQFMKKVSQENRVYLIGGSIPIELEDEKIYNMSYTFDSEGKEIANYSKCHLFDINVPGQIYSKESDTIGFGQKLTTFETPWCTFGLGICYDVRFPLQAMVYRQRGAKVLVYPAAFNPTTGPIHFETTAKARALDTQCFFIFSAPARNTEDTSLYQSYGNSMIINPNGCVVSRAELHETILYYDIN